MQQGNIERTDNESIAASGDEVRLGIDEVSMLFEICRRLREQGTRSDAWRRSLAAALGEVCAASKVTVMELARGRGSIVPKAWLSGLVPVQIVDRGIDTRHRGAFYEELLWRGFSDPTLASLAERWETSFTLVRADLVAAETWQSSMLHEGPYREHGCGDFLVSLSRIPRRDIASLIVLFRPREEPFFGARERSIVSVLHRQVERDMSWLDTDGPPLSPRLRETLTRLTDGLSEKEVASDLGISIHTAHGYVKELRRRFGARSCGELVAAARQCSPVLRPASEAWAGDDRRRRPEPPKPGAVARFSQLSRSSVLE
ncbi:MAG: hypothetical protein HOW73_09170 [Polyangiaceae bacterium]|nr:hypothetical protein [Polyangiaceae bacterium]